MTTTTTYTEVAAADGAWTCPVLLPPTPFEEVRATLTALTDGSGWPIAAFLYGANGDPVTEMLLYRDPSRSFGTPSVSDCIAGAEVLAAVSGWHLAPDRAPHAGVLVGMGLREGYEPDAPQHEPNEIDHLLAEHGTGWSCRTARLVSARLVDGEVRWYDEVGAVVHASADLVPVLERIAARFAQHRFVITDLAGERTSAFVHHRGAAVNQDQNYYGFAGTGRPLADAVTQDQTATEQRWQDMSDAPRDGTPVIGNYGSDGEDGEIEIRWAEERRCVLGQNFGGGAGTFGPGWEDTYNGLYAEDPISWRPVGTDTDTDTEESQQ